MTTFDLGIEGATVVTARERRRANVYVSGGRIAAVSDGREPAREVVDAGGLLLLPGMVDTHVHLMDPAETEREDFPTGTAAAARAGVTTVVEHTHAGPVRRPEDLIEKREYLRDRSRVDFGLAAHAWSDTLEQVEPLWREGVTFFKAFTCTTHGVPGLDDVRLRDLFERVAALGAVCLVHSEDETVTAEAERALRAAGRDDGGVVPEWRSREAELTALERVTGIARETGARIVLAHVSHREALDVVSRERALGARVLAECCPQYLTLLEDEVREHGALRKFTPPARARTQDDLRAMWAALADGTIHHVSTDHAPSSRAQEASGSIWEAPFGLPGLDTTLPVLLDGAALGLLSYERVVEAYAEAPARAYGLFPRKGGVAVGSDADLVLVDHAEHWTVRDDDVISKAGWSPLAERTLTGRAIRTFLRERSWRPVATPSPSPGSASTCPAREPPAMGSPRPPVQAHLRAPVADIRCMTRIRTTCPTCGEVDIAPDAVLLYLPPARDRWFYSFTCPVCGRGVHHAATREIVAMLVAAGEKATAQAGISLEDRAPDPTAPPFTLDDLIELHFLLQDELTIPKLLHR